MMPRARATACWHLRAYGVRQAGGMPAMGIEALRPGLAWLLSTSPFFSAPGRTDPIGTGARDAHAPDSATRDSVWTTPITIRAPRRPVYFIAAGVPGVAKGGGMRGARSRASFVVRCAC
jgi:hypothetical protein